MLTEDEARDLLQTAAATIEVPPAAPLVLPVRRHWVAPVVAAAAVLAAVVVGFLVVQNGDRLPSAPVDVPTPVVPQPTGRIPSVFGYDADSATRMLTSLGLKVRRETETSCNTPGRALRTEPEVGARLKSGQRITLFVSDAMPNATCKMPDRLAWKILDFANGRGADPGFASDVRFWLNGKPSDSAEALSALSALTTRGVLVNGVPRYTAYLDHRDGFGTLCQELPGVVDGRAAYTFTIEFPANSIPFGCPSAKVYTDADGSIDALLVWAPSDYLRPLRPDPVDPDTQALATRLLKFANGAGTRFPGNERVRFYSEGLFWNSLTGPQAEDRNSYSLCSGVAPADCGATYLLSMDVARGGYTVVPDLPACFDPKRVVGEGRGGGSRTAYITNPVKVPCAGAWAIQIRYDAPDRLVAVNVMSTIPDPERDLRDLADRFIDFARGKSDSLPVDTPVELYLNDHLFRTVTPTQAEDRDTYALCNPRSSACAAHAVELIRSVAEVPALRRDSRVPACLDALPPSLTAQQTGGTRSVVITNVDDPCAWAVQLWFNDVDQLVAVDLRTHKQA